MRTLGNLLWFLLGGIYMGLGWWLAGLLAYISIVGIPFGRSCFEIGTFTFFPFGYEALERELISGTDDLGTGALGLLGNVIWFVFCGWWLALGHLATAIPLFVSIIGIPFGIQHVKIAGLTLSPIGKTIVRSDVAAAARRE